MIKKIEIVKNVGNFNDYVAEGQVALSKMNLIYAENGAGKTTLARVLHSLSAGDGAVVQRHKRINGTGEPSVLVRDDANKEHKYNNGVWNRPIPEVEVFDAHFVNNNVYSGFDVNSDHHKKLYQFVVGEAGVKIIRRIEKAKTLKEAVDYEWGNVDNQIGNLSGGLDANSVCKLKPVPEIDAAIAQAEAALKVAKNQDKIKKQARPQKIAAPDIGFETDNAKTVLATTTAGIGHAYLEQVSQHFEHLKSNGVPRSKQWVSEGMSATKDGRCPFCGQGLGTSELFTGYGQYFSEAYKEASRKANELKTNFGYINIGSYLVKINSDYEKIGLAMEPWKDLVKADAPLPTLNLDDLDLKGKYNALKALLEAKANDPVSAVDVQALTDYVTAKAEAERRIKAVNDYVDAYVKQVEALCANIGDATEAQKAYDSLLLSKRRFEAPLAGLCSRHVVLANRSAKLKRISDKWKQKQTETSEKLFQTYGDKINYYLDKVFHTKFRIEEVKGSQYRGRQKEPTLDYVLKFNGNPIDMATGDNNCSFKNVLSEGDKGTIAFSFFLAKLVSDPDYANKIVVFDDPLSSLDWKRRRSTVNELNKLFTECKQLIVFSHHLHFLIKLNDRVYTKDKSILQIENVRGDATIKPYELMPEWTDKYKHALDKMQAFLVAPTQDGVLDAIEGVRVSLETFIKLKYCRLVNQNNMLVELVNALEGSAVTFKGHDKKDVIRRLRDLNNDTKDYHHGTLGYDAIHPEELPDKDEVVGMVEEAMELLDKIL